ncbi:MAG: ATP-binding cassette domain-containing protein [Bacteroidota bacterium]
MHYHAILTNNRSQTNTLVENLIQGNPIRGLEHFQNKRGVVFSRFEIDRLIDEEERHDMKIVTRHTSQPLKTMSSGEQKRALLNYLLQTGPDFLVLVNPFDNLDTQTQKQLKEKLNHISKSIDLVQVVTRVSDILPLTTSYSKLENDFLHHYPDERAFWKVHQHFEIELSLPIPPPLTHIEIPGEELVSFKKVSVSFDGNPILQNIDWCIKKGDFWQLMGPNGSGKTTLLNMITGDSHKGYGQDLAIFGQKKGSGESVWDLKENIGYFTPSMTDKFKGYHTLEHMLISGLHDSIGLYIQPSDTERQLAREWLTLLGMYARRNQYFQVLTTGEKRLIMIARAMIKHPPLLILDEPTAGLDDTSAALFIALVNKMANESTIAIIFVSHRKEAHLKPQFVYGLQPTLKGSTGTVNKL